MIIYDIAIGKKKRSEKEVTKHRQKGAGKKIKQPLALKAGISVYPAFKSWKRFHPQPPFNKKRQTLPQTSDMSKIAPEFRYQYKREISICKPFAPRIKGGTPA